MSEKEEKKHSHGGCGCEKSDELPPSPFFFVFFPLVEEGRKGGWGTTKLKVFGCVRV